MGKSEPEPVYLPYLRVTTLNQFKKKLPFVQVNGVILKNLTQKVKKNQQQQQQHEQQQEQQQQWWKKKDKHGRVY